MKIWCLWDLGAIVHTSELRVTIHVFYLLWESSKDKYALDVNGTLSFRGLLYPGGKAEPFLCTAFSSLGDFFHPVFPCDQTINWTMGKECDSSVYSYFRNAFIILWTTDNKTWCLLIKSSSWWEGVKRIQSFLAGQLYFSQVWLLQSKTVGKGIFQDPKGYQLPTLHFFLASLSTFKTIPTCQKLRSLFAKVKLTQAPEKPTVT